MKAERRHELKESDLTHALERGQIWLQTHGKRVGLYAGLVIVVVIVVTLVARSRAAAVEDRWRQRALLAYDTPDVAKKSLTSLMSLAKNSNDDRFSMTALIDLGNQALRSATAADASPDRELNDMAREAFELLLKRFDRNPLALGVAYLGLATVEENQFAEDGNEIHKENARRHLQALLDNPALHKMPTYTVARDRLEILDHTFTKVTFAPPLPPEEIPEPAALPSEPATGTLRRISPPTMLPAPAAPAPAPAPPVEKKADDKNTNSADEEP